MQNEVTIPVRLDHCCPEQNASPVLHCDPNPEQAVSSIADSFDVVPNRIAVLCALIAPDVLTSLGFDQHEIDHMDGETARCLHTPETLIEVTHGNSSIGL
jgi:hypothetical protein